MWNLLYILLFVIASFWLLSSYNTNYIENLENNKCDCSQLSMLTNLSNQYNTLSKDVDEMKKELTNTKNIANLNKTDLTKINNMIKELETASEEKK